MVILSKSLACGKMMVQKKPPVAQIKTNITKTMIVMDTRVLPRHKILIFPLSLTNTYMLSNRKYFKGIGLFRR